MSKPENGGPAQPKKDKKQPQQNAQVIQLNRCMEEECKARPQKAGFCNEHYAWFKYGLITKDGSRAKDFDKKMMAYKRTHEKKVA